MEQNHEYLRRLFRDSRIVELRHSYGDQRESGIFNNIVNLERAVRDLADVGNMYTSLNRPHSFRVTNCFRSDALRDEDIETITRIVFDLDPKRPTNLPSTDAELKSALTARDLVDGNSLYPEVARLVVGDHDERAVDVVDLVLDVRASRDDHLRHGGWIRRRNHAPLG